MRQDVALPMPYHGTMTRHLLLYLAFGALAPLPGCGEIVDGEPPDGIDCGMLEAPPGGSVATPMTTFGAIATYSCDPGYDLLGSPARSCLEDATWSGTAPICRPVDCGTLPRPQDGDIALDMTTFGAMAMYSCGAGFNLVGDAVRTCLADGSWSGLEPTCVPGCSCFDSAQLDAIEADIAAGGSSTCVVDSAGGGTTITALISATNNRRYVASALYNASLPGTQLACEYGCLDDTPSNGIDECAGLPAFQQTRSITQEDHDRCRAMIEPRCAP